ncbi:HAD family hydrolase [Verminephrobacter aporrectodeae]|uniref:HAD family phosphatase n=1 Tax=Verminephrobacter aporrectodeae subsp. tuberculatae TaxID=1110392 RepID=A0ABT3KR18_9BURK|nr:HAD family phosphatase [Verminephrobacter aporrectodeae]MCW5255740.1 HAD family phosphatase [Verminephrobacter aporrectodeae subsp. tuberculatae]MCW5320761.1 HAD family phosphatase [Verminephrobacter aporrectodeae subsp. tuberculatae]MCW8176242.1 HAD family phosphatase [Verminephrobacter aporrectodeae subsp. tuberculatae]MCW8199173.1 HAD family phosphatase [Verminephrobacter aporrectodeae subsp. tuberculatae]MCW8203903.1 HAD family phosphatase [Verminephrobacter aporrectodeae subsp. tubercu
MRTEAIIFDMDGTMVDSMPWHSRAWGEFARRRAVPIDLPDFMSRTTGRNGAECLHELLGRVLVQDEVDALTREKEDIYRELFAPHFAEVAGFRRFAAEVAERGLKVAVGTAGDIHSVRFVLSQLGMEPAPLAIVRGDEGLPGKPRPDIFLEAARRIAAQPAHCIVFEDAPFGIEAARRAGMRAVAICSTHSAQELAGPHVLAAVRDYTELMNTDFLERIHVATA